MAEKLYEFGQIVKDMDETTTTARADWVCLLVGECNEYVHYVPVSGTKTRHINMKSPIGI